MSKRINYLNEVKKMAPLETKGLPGYPFMGTLFIALLTLSLILWAYFSHIDIGMSANGIIKFDTPIYHIHAQQPGKLTVLAVKNGEKVKKGQLIAELSPTGALSDFKATEIRYVSLLANKARLEAQLDNKAKINFSNPIFAKYPAITQSLRQQFITEQSRHKNKLISIQAQIAIVDDELSKITHLVKQKILARKEAVQLQQNQIKLRAMLSEEKSKYYSQIKKELSSITPQISEVKSEMTVTKNKLDQKKLYSPIDGIINKISYEDTGVFVKPGSDIVTVMPLHSSLHVRLQVTPNKISFIEPGTKVKVRVNAYDFSVYGILNGTVTNISKNTVFEPTVGKESSKNMFYIVTVATDKNAIHWKGQVLTLHSGMTVIAKVNTHRISLLTYIFKPIVKTFKYGLGQR